MLAVAAFGKVSFDQTARIVPPVDGPHFLGAPTPGTSIGSEGFEPRRQRGRRISVGTRVLVLYLGEATERYDLQRANHA
jgi:hypothetical protein